MPSPSTVSLIDSVKLDLAKMQARKAEVVTANVKGVEFLFRKNKITWLKGTGRIAAPGQVDVDGTVYETKNIVIATGSEVDAAARRRGRREAHRHLDRRAGTRQSAGHLVVIGAGVIGLELGSVWRRLGAHVTVIEFLDRILRPAWTVELATAARRVLTKQGLTFRLGAKVTGAATAKTASTLTVEPAERRRSRTDRSRRGAAGHRPPSLHRRAWWTRQASHWTSAAGSGPTPIYATNVPGIYAIGDASPARCWPTRPRTKACPWPKSSWGKAGHVNYGADPRRGLHLARGRRRGQTEEETESRGSAYNIGKLPFTANGRARAMGDTDGFVKLLADKTTDRLLGAHIIGPDAGTLHRRTGCPPWVRRLGRGRGAHVPRAPRSANEAVKEAGSGGRGGVADPTDAFVWNYHGTLTRGIGGELSRACALRRAGSSALASQPNCVG